MMNKPFISPSSFWSVFYQSRHEASEDRNWCQKLGYCDGPDHVDFVMIMVGFLKFGLENSIEFSHLNELL